MTMLPAELTQKNLPEQPSKALQRILARRGEAAGQQGTAGTTGTLPTLDTSLPAAGTWQPKKLSQKHKHIVALHLQRAKREEIAQICDCTPEYVSMVVKTNLAKQYAQELEDYMDQRVRTAYGKAVDVLHDSLESDDEENRLKAARLTFEVTGKMKPKSDDAKTAEDVVASILSQASTVIIGHNVQVNNTIPSGE